MNLFGIKTDKKNFFIIAVSLLIALTLYIPFSQNKWGLMASYYRNSNWTGIPALKRIEKIPEIKGNTRENVLSEAVFSVKWEGYIVIKNSGAYQFTSNSDDGSIIVIDGQTIVDNGGAHGLKKISNQVTLEKGIYPIEILYFQIGGYNILEVLWSSQEQYNVYIPHDILFAKKPTWLHIFYRKIVLKLPQILAVVWILFLIGYISIFFMNLFKTVSLKYVIQSLGLSLVSILFFGLTAEFLSRIKYIPRKLDYNWIFEYDKNKIFRLKSNYEGIYGDVKITTNAYGFRDENITVNKSSNMLRVLVLGDSITFGHGDVLQHELYSEVLEDQFNQYMISWDIDVLNMGCPGNSAWQEYYDLKNGLQFQPDVVIVQYTLNDVTEPYLVAKRHGGDGLDYHGVKDIPYYDYLLSQNSAFYLFLKNIISRIKFQSITKSDLQRKALEREVLEVLDNLVRYHDHPKIKTAWEEYLKWLKKIVTLCHERNIPCILLISPYSFQLEFDNSFAYPQKILNIFAKENGFITIDLLAYLQQEFKDQMTQKYSLSPTTSYSNLIAYIKEHDEKEIRKFWHFYFIDADHYTREGHKYVAHILYSSVLPLFTLKMQESKQ